MKTGVVLFAHGSRDPEWAAPFRAIERRLAASRPDAQVALAFLEFMEPTLPQAVERMVAAGCERITVAPLFMAQGAHLKRDLARLIADATARHTAVQIAALPAAGETDGVMNAIGDWIAQSIER